jgi:hypothetical protein
VYEKILPKLNGKTIPMDCFIVPEWFTKSGLKKGMQVNIHAVLPYDTPIINSEKYENVSTFISCRLSLYLNSIHYPLFEPTVIFALSTSKICKA